MFLDNLYYVPCTVLQEDIRNIIIKSEPIKAILSKKTNSKLYSNIIYSAKGIDIIEENLPNEILKKIDKNNLVDNRRKLIPRIISVEKAIASIHEMIKDEVTENKDA